MSKNLPKDIGNLFKESIEKLEQTPSAAVWEKLNRSLNSEPIKNKKKFSRRNLLLLLLLCLMTCTGILYKYNNSNKKINSLAQTATKMVPEKNGFPNQETGNMINTNNDIKKDTNLSNTLVKTNDQLNNKIATIKKEMYTKQKNWKVEKEPNDLQKLNLAKTNDPTSKSTNSIKNHSIKIQKNTASKPDLQPTNTIKNMLVKTKRNTIEKSRNEQYETTIDDNLVNKSNQTIVDKSKSNIKIAAPDAETNNETAPLINEIATLDKTAASVNNDTTKKISAPIASAKEMLKKSAIEKSNKKNSFKNRFFITAFTAPEYAYFNIVKNENISNPYDNSAQIKEREKETSSSSMGMLLGYDLNKKIAIQLGITYTFISIENAASKVYAQKTEKGDIGYRYNTSIGYTYFKPAFNPNPVIGDSLYATSAEHSLAFISIPLLMKYKINFKKWSFNPTIGLTLNFLSKSLLETEIRNNTNAESEIYTKFDGVKQLSYSAFLAPELQHTVYKKWSLVALPYLKYSIGSVNRNGIVKTNPFFVGAGFGINYKF